MRTLMSWFLTVLTVALMEVSDAVGIDDVTGKQLEAVMDSEDFLAVYWYTKNCKTCERVITVLERVSDEIAEAGVTIVKVNDKKAAKAQAVRNFPALTFFKGGDGVQFEGDLMSSDSILDFLAAPGSTDLPNQIDDVTASQLETLVHEKTYVAVFFFTGNRESSTILAGLETVDEDAGKLGVAFVKINDLELVAEYNLGKLPALVYYRHTIPILYEGDLSNSADVLEWLIQNRHSGDGEDVIEEVDSTTIHTMVAAVENIAVLFYDAKSRRVDQLLENLEMIDDDCDTRGIHFVKIAEAGAGAKFGIDTLPTLVFFRSNVPNIFDGELLDGPAVLQWLLTHLESDEIEEVTSPMLGKLVKDSRHLVVLFYKKGDKEMMDALEALETIDDDFDRINIGMVKIHEPEAAAEWGITSASAIVYFENGIPFIYTGNVKDEREVLRWVKQQFEGDEIEEINPKMLEKIVKSEVGSAERFGAHADAAVLFYKRGDPFSNKVLKMLENIDDECDTYGIIFVKVAEESQARAASDLGIMDLPALVYFEDKIPHLYDGDLRSQDDVLNWLVTQMETDEIEEVTDAMLDKLIESNQYVAAIFYDKGDKTSIKALTALETIDDDLDVHNIVMLKMSDTVEAKNYGVKEFPSLIMFKNRIPELFSGDITDEAKVLEWIFKLAEVEAVKASIFGLGAATTEAPAIEAPAPKKVEKPPPKAEKTPPKVEKPPPKAEKTPPKVEKPPPKAEKTPPKVEKPPLKVEKPPPMTEKVEKPPPKVEKPPPLVKEAPKPVKIKKADSQPKPIKESKPMKDPESQKVSESKKGTKTKKEPEPVKVEEPVEEPEAPEAPKESVTEDIEPQIDSPVPSSDSGEGKDSNNIADSIKNGNNVVAFFSENAGLAGRQNATSVKNQGFFYWLGNIQQDLEIWNTEYVESSLEDCLLFPCAAAKASHKKSLNIDKLQPVPLYKPEGRKRGKSGGWLVWIFGSTDSDSKTEIDGVEIENDPVEDNEQVEEEKEEEGAEEGEGEEKEEETEEDENDIETEDKSTNMEGEETDEDDEPAWYEVTLLPGNEDGSWYEVNLFGEDNEDQGEDDEKPFCKLCNEVISALSVNWLGESNETERSWYEVSLFSQPGDYKSDEEDDEFGGESTKKAFCQFCNEVISIFSVNWLGESDENERSWYEVNLLSSPGDDNLETGERSWYEVDLLGDCDDGDGTNWYEVNLFGSVISADGDNESEVADIDMAEDEEDQEEVGGDADEDGDIDNEESVDAAEDGNETNYGLLFGSDDEEPKTEEEEEKQTTKDKILEEEVDEDISTGEEEIDKMDDEEIIETEKDELAEEAQEEKLVEEEYIVADNIVDSEEKENIEEVPEDINDGEEKEIAVEDSKEAADEEPEEVADEEIDEAADDKNEEAVDKAPDEGQIEIADESADEEPEESADEEPEESADEETEKIANEEPEEVADEEPEEAADDENEEVADEEPEEVTDEGPIEIAEESADEEPEKIADEEPEEAADEALNIETEYEESVEEEAEDFEIEEKVDVPTEEKDEEDNESFGEWLFGSDEEESEVSKEEEIVDSGDDVESVLSDKITISKKREINKADIEDILNDKPEILEELTQYLLAKLLDSKRGEILETAGTVDDTDDVAENDDAEDDESVVDETASEEPIKEEANEDEEALEGKLIKEKENEDEEASADEPVLEQTEYLDDEDATSDEELSETAELIKTSKSSLIIFFYENLDKISKKIISGIVKVEGHFSGKDITFLTVSANDIPEMHLPTVPSLVYFKNGQPTVYEENLMNEEAIKSWVEVELQSNQDVIEDLSSEQVHTLMDKAEYVMVYIYAPDCEACDEAIKQLEEIDDDADAVGVKFVKTEDADFAQEYGISEFPAIIYFEHEQPSIYDGDAAEETELLTWLLYQMKEDTIENINRELMTKMIEEFEFLAVFFYTNADAESGKVLRHLELIDDEASQYGVRLVKIDDPLMSKKYGHREPPGLGYFRKGNYIKYDGDLVDDEEMLDWLTDPNTMEISDQIEKVNKKMFEKLISRNEFLAVMFYSETDCKQCDSVLEELENIDDDAEASGIPIVKLEDKALAKNIGVFALPAIVFFRNFGEEPTIYAGDLKREDSILEWLLIQKDPSNEAIEDMDGEALRKAIDKSDAVAVFVYTQEGCETCLPVLQALENIDDDTDRQKISMVKTIDAAFAEEVGIDKFPGLVFFKDGVPNLYEGDLMLEEEVLDWLIEMKVESHIELITRPMLESMVEQIQYLAVFFYKQNCRTCDQVIVELENIDDDCDMYGIQMVKLKDPQLAKRYGIKTFPALVYFRNGNPLTYDGDLKNEESVLEWLIDDDNRELEDEIEAVNYRMLDKLLETSPFMAVFFYDDECIECEAILEQLENIDDEADIYGIDFVKNNDPHAAKQYNIYNTPALVYFRKMTPIVYDGDLMDDERILEWLTSQDVFEIKDEIEEVNRKMLEKLLDENEFVAVYFYEDDCPECNEVLEGLERIDDETDALDITFVKINDPRYAKKYGVNKLPALVYFRRKFPSIYRDSLLGEAEVLEWLTTNRYKQMELGVFMYAIIALAVTFMFYTAFLMFGLKPREPEKKKEE